MVRMAEYRNLWWAVSLGKENMLPRNPIITNAIVSGSTQENGSLPVQITIEAQENCKC